ncbi:MAG: anthranilate synthase component I [Candidatus Methylomirabilia bacterium]
MFNPTKEEFKKKCKEGNLIPVSAEIMADLETPVSAFLKLGGGPYSFLLESVEGGGGSGRYSFLGTGPRTVFRAKGRRAEFLRDGEWDGHDTGDPLALLQDELARYKVVPDERLPPFAGGAVGYLAYDAVRWFERLPAKLKDDLDLPDACFMLTDTMLAFDRYTNKITVMALAHVDGRPDAAYTKAVLAIQSVIEALKRPLPQDAVAYLGGAESRGFKSKVSQPRFLKMVETAKEHIRAGDILQTVLSLRFEAPLYADSFAVYRSLRVLNPSPYMFYLNFGEFALVGASPELMVKKIGGEATVRPIAGTRPRGATPEEDRHLERELRADDKERAEHVMLVDLGRNDLGRVCLPGTVKVADYMNVDRYSHVMHLVSTVTGQLKPGTTAFDLVRATFPAGTVSGAPKIRAMEIIEKLEPHRRGPYAGMVGYFDYSGNFDSAITIRTVLAKEGRAYIQTGAGIVADSVAEREYQECKHKARALVRAVEMAQGG